MKLVYLKIILLLVWLIVSLILGILPILIFSCLEKRAGKLNFKHLPLMISLLSCFAGGIIFGVCILHMLPETIDDSESLNEFAFWRRYPWVELFIGIGFFVVYFLDDAIEKICVSDHVHGQKKEVQTTQVQIFNSNLEANNNTEKSEKISKISKLPKISKPIVGAFTLVLALLIHTVLEGFAFGVQNSGVSVTSLFFGIIVHQALLMFSVGMNFAEKIPNNKILATILLIILSAAGPIGTVIGLLIEGSNMSETPKTFVITILNCFSIGCFLFVTFFDIITVERANEHNSLLQWLACLVGFVLMGVIIYLAGDEHENDSNSLNSTTSATF